MFKGVIHPKAIIMPLLFLAAICLGFLVQNLGLIEGCDGAIIPLVPSGLKGIFFSPFLHGSWEHILGNSLPLVVLSSLLYQFYGSVADRVMLYGWLFSGLTVWMTPSINLFDHQTYTSCIIGASGVIYVLAFFLFASGVIRWNLKLLTVSLIVALYYGSMIWGMIPEELLFTLSEPSRISWQSHLSGAVIGVIMAFIYKDKGEKRKKFIWEYPEYYNEKDDILWQKYIQENPEDFRELPYRKKEDIWDFLDEIRNK